MFVNVFCRLSIRLSLVIFVCPVCTEPDAPTTQSSFGPAYTDRSPQSEGAVPTHF